MANAVQRFVYKVVRSFMSFNNIPMADPQISTVWRQWLGGMGDTVENVNPTSAQCLSAVYQAVGIHSRTNASLPLSIFKKSKSGGRTEAVDHPLYQVLKYGVNPEMDSFQFKEIMTGHLHLRGNAYALKYIDGSGDIYQLVALHPERVAAIRDLSTGVLYYKIADMHGVYHDFPRDYVLHVKNRTEDGVYGLSTIQMARHDLDRQMQMQKYGTNLFRNSARPSGVLEHPGQISKDAADRLRESWQSTYAGPENAGKAVILEENMTYKPMSMTPEDSQFVEQEGNGVADVARWFNLPQHMLGLTDKSTFSNMEQEALEFLKFTVFPECRRWESAYNYQLLTASERKKGYEIRYVIREIDRADTATRFASYAVGRQWGFMSADEIREREDLSPIPEDGGKIFLQPVNMVDVLAEEKDPQPLPVVGPDGQIQVPTTTPIQPAQGDAPGGAPVNTQPGKRFMDRTKKAYTRMFETQIGSLLTKEAKFVDRIAKKCAKDRDLADFRKQVENFYRDHEALCSGAILDHMIALGEQTTEMSSASEALIRKRATSWASEHCKTNRERVLGMIDSVPVEQLLPAVGELAKQWQEKEFSADAETQVTAILNSLEIAA